MVYTCVLEFPWQVLAVYLKYKVHLKESSKALTGAMASADDLLEDEVDQRVWA